MTNISDLPPYILAYIIWLASDSDARNIRGIRNHIRDVMYDISASTNQINETYRPSFEHEFVYSSEEIKIKSNCNLIYSYGQIEDYIIYKSNRNTICIGMYADMEGERSLEVYINDKNINEPRLSKIQFNTFHTDKYTVHNFNTKYKHGMGSGCIIWQSPNVIAKKYWYYPNRIMKTHDRYVFDIRYLHSLVGEIEPNVVAIVPAEGFPQCIFDILYKPRLNKIE